MFLGIIFGRLDSYGLFLGGGGEERVKSFSMELYPSHYCLKLVT